MRPVERAYFALCGAFGRMLRGGRYSRATVVHGDDERRVRKRRLFYAPLLVRLGGPLVRVLDTGVRVLPQREWEERERRLYGSVHGVSIDVDAGGTLVLPCLPGETLAALLDDRALDEPERRRAVELAALALAGLHRQEVTHGDAMAENVLVDLDAGVARWFDFETVHDAARPTTWRRADDVRALLATCLLRTVPAERAGVLRLILDAYGDDEVDRLLAASFTSVVKRPLAFHLGQAALSFDEFREIGRLLTARVDG